MSLKPSTIIWTFIWCIFMGITVGSFALGAIFPPSNYVAQPFVCPGGHMDSTSQDYTVSPVESGSVITMYCVDGSTGARTELGLFPMSLYSGTIYGLLLFFIVLLGMVLVKGRLSLSN